MNIQIIKGRLTADPELTQTPTGVSVCKFSVAVNRNYTPKGEEAKSDFFNVVAWKQTAEFVSKYFTKGQEILINGEMQCRNYTDKESVKRWVWDLVANKIEFCGNKQEKQETKTFVEVDIDDEDIPF